MTKVPWTASRIILAILASLSFIATLWGLFYLLGASHLLQLANNSKTPEDTSGLGGIIFGVLGLGLTTFGGVLTLLFTVLYISTTRRLKHRH